MNQPGELIGTRSPVRTLALARSHGDEMDVVEHRDGSVAIRIAGHEVPHYCWEAGQIEDCINTYLRLLRD